MTRMQEGLVQKKMYTQFWIYSKRTFIIAIVTISFNFAETSCSVMVRLFTSRDHTLSCDGKNGSFDMGQGGCDIVDK